jgi:hypothetical protein
MSSRPQRPSALKARDNIRASSLSGSESEMSIGSQSSASRSDSEESPDKNSQRM